MSRSGYCDDIDGPELALWRGAVASAIRGKRGQALLRDMAAAMDAMPVKRLIARYLVKDGEVCALGAVACARGMDVSGIDPERYWTVASAFDIADALAREVEYWNDECGPYQETPEQRWTRMRAWVAGKIRKQEEGHAETNQT